MDGIKTDGVKRYIVFDSGSCVAGVRTGVSSWEDSTHRAMVLTGFTYTEAGLRDWGNRSFGTPLDAPLPDIARAIQRGGWIMCERIDPTSEVACPKCGESSWQTIQPVYFSSMPQVPTLRCNACFTSIPVPA